MHYLYSFKVYHRYPNDVKFIIRKRVIPQLRGPVAPVVEILRGVKNERDFQSLNDSLRSLPQIPIDGAVIERASQWGFLLDGKGKFVSTTDLIIASAAYKKARLLHMDSDFELVSTEVDLEEEKIK